MRAENMYKIKEKIINLMFFMAIPIFLQSCTNCFCLTGNTTGKLIGYYRSNVCCDCAGFDIGHLLSDLNIEEDSTFIYRYYATRFSPYQDTTIVLKIEGNWTISNNDLFLKPSQIVKTKVDSNYNHISDTTITANKSNQILARFINLKNSNKVNFKCGEIFSYQKQQ